MHICCSFVYKHTSLSGGGLLKWAGGGALVCECKFTKREVRCQYNIPQVAWHHGNKLHVLRLARTYLIFTSVAVTQWVFFLTKNVFYDIKARIYGWVIKFLYICPPLDRPPIMPQKMVLNWEWSLNRGTIFRRINTPAWINAPLDFWLWLVLSQKLLNRSESNFQHLNLRYSVVHPTSLIEIKQSLRVRLLPLHPARLFGEIWYIKNTYISWNKEKCVLHRKYFRYLHKTETTMFTILSAIRQVKSTLSRTIAGITKVGLFGRPPPRDSSIWYSQTYISYK